MAVCMVAAKVGSWRVTVVWSVLAVAKSGLIWSQSSEKTSTGSSCVIDEWEREHSSRVLSATFGRTRTSSERKVAAWYVNRSA